MRLSEIGRPGIAVDLLSVDLINPWQGMHDDGMWLHAVENPPIDDVPTAGLLIGLDPITETFALDPCLVDDIDL